MKVKRFKVSELEPVARNATRETMKACVPPSDEDRKLLALGTLFTGEAAPRGLDAELRLGAVVLQAVNPPEC